MYLYYTRLAYLLNVLHQIQYIDFPESSEICSKPLAKEEYVNGKCIVGIIVTSKQRL